MILKLYLIQTQPVFIELEMVWARELAKCGNARGLQQRARWGRGRHKKNEKEMIKHYLRLLALVENITLDRNA